MVTYPRFAAALPRFGIKLIYLDHAKWHADATSLTQFWRINADKIRVYPLDQLHPRSIAVYAKQIP